MQRNESISNRTTPFEIESFHRLGTSKKNGEKARNELKKKVEMFDHRKFILSRAIREQNRVLARAYESREVGDVFRYEKDLREIIVAKVLVYESYPFWSHRNLRTCSLLVPEWAHRTNKFETNEALQR